MVNECVCVPLIMLICVPYGILGCGILNLPDSEEPLVVSIQLPSTGMDKLEEVIEMPVQYPQKSITRKLAIHMIHLYSLVLETYC